MRRSEYAMVMSDIATSFAGLKLPDDSASFQAPAGASNETAAKFHDIHIAVKELAVASVLHASAKKRYEMAKIYVDDLTSDEQVPDGASLVMYQDQDFSFAKKRSKGGTDVKVRDLIVELARRGVSNEVIQSAVSAAEKPRPGNLYYVVEKLGE